MVSGMPGAVTSRWLTNQADGQDVMLRVFCLPHAGGGRAAFRAWTRDQPPGVDIRAILLPGRDDRVGEPSPAGIVALAETLAPVLLPYLDVPYALVGNSVGALLAFELGRRLQQRYCLPPLRLVAAASRPPGAATELPPAGALTDSELAREVQGRFGGIAAEILHHPDYLRAFLPPLRADLIMAQAYLPPPGPLLACPVTAVVGAGDVSMSRADLAGWGDLTECDFASVELPGDHFALLGHRDRLLGPVRAEAALVQAGSAAGHAI
jgi:medium-chain acyl-[acyl-carrier-protein] hydrolase